MDNYELGKVNSLALSAAAAAMSEAREIILNEEFRTAMWPDSAIRKTEIQKAYTVYIEAWKCLTGFFN